MSPQIIFGVLGLALVIGLIVWLVKWKRHKNDDGGDDSKDDGSLKSGPSQPGSQSIGKPSKGVSCAKMFQDFKYKGGDPQFSYTSYDKGRDECIARDCTTRGCAFGGLGAFVGEKCRVLDPARYLTKSGKASKFKTCHELLSAQNENCKKNLWPSGKTSSTKVGDYYVCSGMEK